MKEHIASVTSRGRITIPVQVRKHLRLQSRGQVIFAINTNDGSVELKAAQVSTVASLAGVAGTLDRSLTWHEMRRIARDEAFEKYGQAGAEQAQLP